MTAGILKLQEVVGGDAEVARGRGRTLVFAASMAAADAAAAALADAGLEPLLYHRGVPADERAAALDAMRSGCGPQGGMEGLSAITPACSQACGQGGCCDGYKQPSAAVCPRCAAAG